jgi:hypothetical protein
VSPSARQQQSGGRPRPWETDNAEWRRPQQQQRQVRRVAEHEASASSEDEEPPDYEKSVYHGALASDYELSDGFYDDDNPKEETARSVKSSSNTVKWKGGSKKEGKSKSKMNAVIQVEEGPVCAAEPVFACSQKVVGPSLYTTVHIFGIPVKALCDSGAAASLLSMKTLQLLKKEGYVDEIEKSISHNVPKLTHLYGETLNTPFSVELPYEFGVNKRKSKQIVFLVDEKGPYDCLLGTNALTSLGWTLNIKGTDVEWGSKPDGRTRSFPAAELGEVTVQGSSNQRENVQNSDFSDVEDGETKPTFPPKKNKTRET